MVVAVSVFCYKSNILCTRYSVIIHKIHKRERISKRSSLTDWTTRSCVCVCVCVAWCWNVSIHPSTISIATRVDNCWLSWSFSFMEANDCHWFPIVCRARPLLGWLVPRLVCALRVHFLPLFRFQKKPIDSLTFQTSFCQTRQINTTPSSSSSTSTSIYYSMISNIWLQVFSFLLF